MAPPEVAQTAPCVPRAVLYGSDIQKSVLSPEQSNGPPAGPATDVAQLLEQIKLMESRIKSLESAKDSGSGVPQAPLPEMTAEVSQMQNQTGTDTRNELKLTPTVSWCN
jgi:hypothetical protein